MSDKSRPGDPLPRPQIERLDLPEEDHMAFWIQVIRDFDWSSSRIQSKILYTNKARLPHEGEAPA